MSCFKCRLQLTEGDFGKQLSRLVLSSGQNMTGFKESTKLIKVLDSYPTIEIIKLSLLGPFKYFIWSKCCI